MAFTVWKKEEKHMLPVVITQLGPAPEFSFCTRYPVRLEICLLTPPLLMVGVVQLQIRSNVSRVRQLEVAMSQKKER